MTPIEPTTRRAWAGWVLLAAAVATLGWGAIRLAPAGTHVAAWWPAVGVAVAAGLRARQLGTLGAGAATLAGSLVANHLGGRAPALAVEFALANTVEVVVVCLLVQRCNRHLDLGSTRLVARTAAALLVGAALAGVLIGTAVHLDGGDGPVAARAVATSHLCALLVFLPFARHSRHLPSQAGPAEQVATALALVAATLAVFAPGQSLPVIFLVFPLLAFTAFRQSLRACAAQLILVDLVATAASAAGWGPLVGAVRSAGLAPETTGMLLQVLIGSTAIMVFALRLTVKSRAEALATATRVGRHLEAVIEAAATTAIIQVDLDGVIQVFNQGAVNMLGHAEADVVGRHTPELFHDPDEVAARAAELGIEPGFEVFVRDVRSRRRTADRRDWTFVAADGTRRLVSLVVSRVEDDQGRTIGFLGIAEDVSAQRRVEHLLVQSLEHERALAARLCEADALKNDFVSSVSHELRTPMTSVLGYAELLADQYAADLGDHGARVIDKIQANGLRLLHLVDDLLTLGRVESPAFALQQARVDLGALARSAAGVLEPLAHTHRLRLEINGDTADAPVVGDAAEIERVLVNLLSNAVKFSRPGGSVLVDLGTSYDSVTLTVTDTGIGIPADDLPHVFTRFHRAANTVESATPGTGLGLAIAGTIVERHGGQITLDSVEGHGTTVTVTLPRDRELVAG